MNDTPFFHLADLCDALSRTARRSEKTRLLRSFLTGLKDEEIAPAVLQIIGTIFPEAESRRLDIGFSMINRIMNRRNQTTLSQTPLTILKVKEYLDEVSAFRGKRSRKRKENILRSLLGEASPHEVGYLIRMISGEMGHGVGEGIMIEAIASAARMDPELVIRAAMLTGDLGEVARIAILEGEPGIRKIQLKIFRPVKPMLAEMAYSIEEVLSQGKQWAFEYKFDGARIQIHKKGDDVRIFSRRLTDVTRSLPELVEMARKFHTGDAVLEGEVIAIKNGKPLPFQELMRRFRRIQEVDVARRDVAVRLFLFDLLSINGTPTIDMPYRERRNLLSGIVDPSLMAERKLSCDAAEMEAFLDQALAEGHEGLMAKALESPYIPGKRGKNWFKIKPVQTLDLVIVAADWGHGRRKGWLSNYHLGAGNGERGFAIVGKTFKGLTDQEFRYITGRLLDRTTSETDYTVSVVPEIVVEVAYNEIQRSPTYASGFALRFARITRIREDKSPQEADTIASIKELYEKQFERKGRSGQG